MRTDKQTLRAKEYLQHKKLKKKKVNYYSLKSPIQFSVGFTVGMYPKLQQTKKHKQQTLITSFVLVSIFHNEIDAISYFYKLTFAVSFRGQIIQNLLFCLINN